jgi:hypothetical protein
MTFSESALRARLAPNRGRAPLAPASALALVREHDALDFSGARARAGIARGHLIDIVVRLPGGRNAAGEQEAAERLVELVLGEARRADWVGSVTSLAAPRGGLLTVVQASPDEALFFPIDELEAAVDAAISGIHAGLPEGPLCELGGEHRWYLLELDVEAASEFPAQSDVALVSTFMPELVKCFLSGEPFASARFSRAGEVFAYLKYESREPDPRQALARRRILEDALDAALVSERAGRVIGGGMGVLYSYIDFAFSNVGRALDAVRAVGTRVGLPERSWVQFFDSVLADEWVALAPHAPKPPLARRAPER